MKRNALLLGLLMGGAVFHSSALTVGRVRGAAWIGQPLALSVPVQMDSTADSANLCAEADVYYADTLQDPARVRVQQVPGAQANAHVVQIHSAASIDEPMVTVYLRVGCGQKVSRRFVLLADYPSLVTPVDATPTAAEAVATPAPTDAPTALQAAPLDSAAPATAPAASSAAAQPTPSSATAAPAKPAARKATRPAPERKKAAAVQAPVPAPQAAAQAAPGGQRARLKLDPLEDLSERIKTLETTTTALPLEDIVRDAQRIQQLQGDVKKLLDQAAENEAKLTEMRKRLEQAEADRVSSTLVYSLGVLVLACLAAIAVLWNRRTPRAASHASWQTSQQDDGDDPAPVVRRSAAVPAPATAVAATPASATTVPAAVSTPPANTPEMAMDLVEMEVDDDVYDKLIHTAPAAPVAAVDSAAPDSEPLPLLGTGPVANDFNADAQFDLRQQAEFFDRLGKTDEAIELLEKRIRANSKDCPLIYLELLRIANTRSLKTDFRQFRDECMQTFNVTIPEFALFRNEGQALDAYPDILAHIEKVWHTPKALEVLESCILRDPWEKNTKPFDMAAFRDLIVLHGLACQAAPAPRAAAAAASTSKQSDAPDAISIDFEL